MAAAASRPDRGTRVAGGTPLLRVPTVGAGRNQEQATGPSYEEARQLALRCATKAEDLEPLVAAVTKLAQGDPTRRIPAALELRNLASALDNDRLAAAQTRSSTPRHSRRARDRTPRRSARCSVRTSRPGTSRGRARSSSPLAGSPPAGARSVTT
jgi:hypothetical protein